MSDGCADTKRHVRAAREWLGRAENSLEREDNIRGGLNLMLAEAELQRARETGETPKWRRWLLRLLPAMVAAGIVAAVFGIVPLAPEWPPETAPLPPPAALPAMVPPAAESLATKVVPSPAVPLPVEPVGPPPEEEITEAEYVAPAAILEEPVPVETEALTEAAPAEAVSAGTPRIPSEDMQRLMSSAGQSLRAQ